MLSLYMLSVQVTTAQNNGDVLRKRVDSVLLANYNRVNYDTNYITRPKNRLTLKVRTNVSGYGVHASGTVNDIYSRANLHTSTRTSLSLGASYRGISAGLSVNPSSLSGKNHDYELNINLYSNRYSIDFTYHRAKTLSGNIERNGSHILEKDHVNMNMITLAGYFTFNYKRFSYPAAFTQSYIQKRSVGSWLAGFSYQGGIIKTADEIPAFIPEARIYVGHFGLGGGYAYNLVVGKKWLFHISLLPTLVIYNRSNITLDGERKDIYTKFPDMIFNEHAAIIYNFSHRYFAGATLVVNNTLYNDNAVTINQNKWRTRIFLGMRI